jgi:carbamoyl-phosphate synthase small subunit
MDALLALEDGRTFACRSFTGKGEAAGEVVFNTGMTGYQEVLTDPSYSGQMVAAFLIKEYQAYPSNFRSTSTLADYLTSHDILGVEHLDTRAITRHIRNAGAMRAIISTDDLRPASLVKRANEIPQMAGLNLAKVVTTPDPFYWERGKPEIIRPDSRPLDKTIWRHRGVKRSVIAFDFGIKFNILRQMEKAGFELVVVPSATTADSIRAMAPDGIFLSNGPGDPEPVSDAIETIRSLLDYRPIFGICLGHQLLGLALGAKTFKLKFGHRGANQPVKNFRSGKVEITSQNHGFAVDTESLQENDVEITHINLNDNTLEGFRHRKYPVFSVQYHPEASPGPHDARYLFDEFKEVMK